MAEFAMTGAEFRCARHLLGLPAQWLAVTWDNDLRTVQRWEQGESVPPGVAAQMEGLLAEAFDVVEGWAASLPDGATFEVPRTDADLEDTRRPASWYRAIGARLMDERPDVRLAYTVEREPTDRERIASALATFKATYPTHSDIRLESRRCAHCMSANPGREVHTMIVAFDPSDAGAVRRGERNWCPFGGQTATGYVVPNS